MIAIKISKIIGILHKLEYIFPNEILLIIYKTLIMFWLLIMGSKSKRYISSSEKTHTISDA